jgi:hypothetical protein
VSKDGWPLGFFCVRGVAVAARRGDESVDGEHRGSMRVVLLLEFGRVRGPRDLSTRSRRWWPQTGQSHWGTTQRSRLATLAGSSSGGACAARQPLPSLARPLSQVRAPPPPFSLHTPLRRRASPLFTHRGSHDPTSIPRQRSREKKRLLQFCSHKNRDTRYQLRPFSLFGATFRAQRARHAQPKTFRRLFSAAIAVPGPP